MALTTKLLINAAKSDTHWVLLSAGPGGGLLVFRASRGHMQALFLGFLPPTLKPAALNLSCFCDHISLGLSQIFHHHFSGLCDCIPPTWVIQDTQNLKSIYKHNPPHPENILRAWTLKGGHLGGGPQFCPPAWGSIISCCRTWCFPLSLRCSGVGAGTGAVVLQGPLSSREGELLPSMNRSHTWNLSVA